MYLCLFRYIWWHKVVFKRLGPDQKTQNAGVKNLLRGKYKLQHLKLYVMAISFLDWQDMKLYVMLISYLDWREKGLRVQLDLRWVRILTSLVQTLSILEIQDSLVFVRSFCAVFVGYWDLIFACFCFVRLLRFDIHLLLFVFCFVLFCFVGYWDSLSVPADSHISLSDSLHNGTVLATRWETFLPKVRSAAKDPKKGDFGSKRS